MRFARRLADAARSPSRLASFVRRAGELMLRGELHRTLKRLRPRSCTPGEYRAWRAALAPPRDEAVPFLLLLDAGDRDSARALREPLGAFASRARATLVRDGDGRWHADDPRSALPLSAWVARAGVAWLWWVRQPLRFAAGAPQALGEACRMPAARIVYADHDVADASGRPAHPVFRSAFDVVQARAGAMAGPWLAVHASLAARLDGRSADALMLDVAATSGDQAIVHVPYVCAHVAGGARRALRPRVASAARAVSVVVPTRDRPRLLDDCLRSVLRSRGGHDVELIVVDNGSADPAVARVVDALRARATVDVVPMPGPFNFARLCNAGVAAARGEIVVLLNNDCVVGDGWLDEVATLACEPGIGAVGPLLRYPDGRLQSAGVLVGVNRTATSALVGFAPDDPLARDWCATRRRVSAVLGACLAVERAKYLAAGGLDERLAVSHNEVDFCLRLEAAGLANAFTPFAQVMHHEGATRGFEVTSEERARLADEEARFLARWGDLVAACDPAYHPAYARQGAPFGLLPAAGLPSPRAGWRVPAARPRLADSG